MITRIVKLTFQEEMVGEFFTHFETIKWKVAEFPGCHGMRLHQDQRFPNVIFTYSLWENEASLNYYRDSALFQNMWPTIKPWFKEKAEAWTVSTYFDGFSK
ncbi:MAG: putative quinol monooxygenase [Crocinitomicaceae bacterium]